MGVEEEAEEDAGYAFLSFLTLRLTRPQASRGDTLCYIRTVVYVIPSDPESPSEMSCRCRKLPFLLRVGPKTYT